jgi:hypothetical protein
MGKKSAAIAACAALLLGACGGGGGDDQQARDAVFLEMSHEVMPDATDANLLKMRAALCEALDASPTRDAYLAATAGALKASAGTFTAEQVGKVNAYAVTTGCPQHEDLVKF